jgi:hypothetical protein
MSPSGSRHLLSLLGKDIRVTGIEDGHGGATEKLSESSTKLDLQNSQVSVKNGYPPKSVKTSSLGGPEDK